MTRGKVPDATRVRRSVLVVIVAAVLFELANRAAFPSSIFRWTFPPPATREPASYPAFMLVDILTMVIATIVGGLASLHLIVTGVRAVRRKLDAS